METETPAASMPRSLAWLRIGALTASIAALFAVIALTGSINDDRVRDAVDPLGWIAPVAFVGLAALLLLAMFPVAPIGAASGLLFTTAEGTLVTFIGAMTGALITFAVARVVAADATDVVASPGVRSARDWIDERGFVAVLYARIAPTPFSLVSYLAGVTRVSVTAYAAGTALGSLPRLYAYTALGGNLDDLDSPEAVTAAILLVVMFVIGLVVLLRDRAQRQRG